MSIALALDVDGVLVKGHKVIANAIPALKKLVQQRIPHVFLTNGGGMTEEKKAEQLSSKLGVEIDPRLVILSHTPIQRLDADIKSKPVLVLGHEECLHVARSYGFKNPITSDMLHADYPDMYPQRKPSLRADATTNLHKEIAGAVIFSDPLDWGLEIQALTDLMLHNPNFPLYVTNADIVYTGAHPQTRYTQGAFVHAFSSLYSHHTGQQPIIHYCGKPYGIQYEYAETVLRAIAAEMGSAPPTTFYGIGDNPKSDIRGANNAGSHWRSILVRTGVFVGENDPIDVADMVEDDILSAVNTLLEAHPPCAHHSEL